MRLSNPSFRSPVPVRALVACIAILATSVVSFADPHPNRQRGVGGVSMGQIDSVSPFNGNLSMAVPIGNPYHINDGLSYQLTLNYNSNVWEFTQSSSGFSGGGGYGRQSAGSSQLTASPVSTSNAGLGWSLHLGRLLPSSHPDNSTGTWTYISPSGAERLFYPRLHPEYTAEPGVWYTRDGSYLRMKVGASGVDHTVEFPDGTIHSFNNPSPNHNGSYGYLTRMADRHGNALNVQLLGNRWVLSDGHRTHTIHFATNDSSYGRVMSVNLAAFGGARAWYYLSYSNQLIGDPCDSGGGIVSGQYQNLLTAIGLPHGLSYTMGTADYHLDTSGGCRLPGKLRGITLPTLGRIEWGYGDYEFPGNAPSWRKTTAGVVARRSYEIDSTTPLGTWSYSPSYLGNEFVNTVVAPSPGGIRKHYFSVAREDSGLWQVAEYGLPVTKNTTDGGGHLSREVFTNGGTPLRRTYLAFDVDPPNDGPGGNPLPFLDEVNANRRMRFSRTRYVDDSNIYADVTLSDWDGLGHHRVTTTGGSFPSYGNVRKVTTNFNPGQGTYPSPSWTMVPSSAVWLLNDYDAREVEEQAATARSEFCFDQTTGLLKRVRILEGTTRSADDVVTEFVRSTVGTNVTIVQKHFGGDSNSAATGACAASMGASPEYQSESTFVNGGLQRIRRQRQTSGGSTVWYSPLTAIVDASTGLPSRTTDSAGDYTNYTYDQLGRLTWEKPVEDSWVHHTWTKATSASSRARVVSEYFANGSTNGSLLAKTQSTFDAFGRSLNEKRLMPDGTFPARWFGYDAVGNRSHVSVWGDSTKKTQYQDYDPFGRPGRIRPVEGATHDVVFGYLGVRQVRRTSKVFDGSSEVDSTTTEIYDRQGRLKSVEEPSGSGGSLRTTTYAYDVGSRLRSVFNGGQTRTFTYDNRGFLLSERHPELGPAGFGYTTYCGYDSLGNVSKSLNGSSSGTSCQSTSNQQSLRYLYDADGLLLEVKEGDGATPRTLKKYTYDTARRLQYAQNYQFFDLDDGSQSTQEVEVKELYQYHGDQGRVSNRSTYMLLDGSLIKTFHQSWLYDDLGNPTTTNYPECATCSDPSRTIGNAYTNGWLTAVTESQHVTPITYHSSGMVHQVQHINNVNQIYEADPFGLGRPKSIRTTGVQGNENWDTGDYVYDGSGNIAQIGDPGGVSSFGYDQVGRLVSSQVYTGRVAGQSGATTASQSFDYDRWGNLTSLTPGYSVPVSSTTNRMTGSGVQYDHAGNLTAWGGWTYEYDPFGNMVHRKTGSGTNRKDWFFAYTADGERLLSYYRDDLDIVGGNLVQNYQMDFTVRDLDGKVLRTWVGDDWEQDYVYRAGTLLVVLYPTTAHHIFPDHLGTPRLSTDSTGNKLAFHVYRPYGEELSSLAQDAERMKFTGHERDMGSSLTSGQDDLDYMHARHYNMMVGRFLQPDPVLGGPRAPQSWNRYSYVVGNPISYVDPTGMEFAESITVIGSDPGGGGPPPGSGEDGGFDSSFFLWQWLSSLNRQIEDRSETRRETVERAVDLAVLLLDTYDHVFGLPEQEFCYTKPDGIEVCGTVQWGIVAPSRPSITNIRKALNEVYDLLGGPLPKMRPGKFGSPQRGTPRRGYRLDPGHDKVFTPLEERGPHINWWDYSGGKRGAGGRSGAVPIK